MAGVKQFDRDDLLDHAMTVFWRNGYQATSIQDLVEATGVNRGSLYATFGDKRGLFLAVIEHYSDRFGKPVMAELNDPDPRRAIERMLEAIVGRTAIRNGRGVVSIPILRSSVPAPAMKSAAKSRNSWGSRSRRFIRYCAAHRRTA